MAYNRDLAPVVRSTAVEPDRGAVAPITAPLPRGAHHRHVSARTTLTERERAVVKLIAEGYTNKELARILGITVKTAECHRANAMKRIGAHNMALLVRYAVLIGLVDRPPYCCQCQVSFGV